MANANDKNVVMLLIISSAVIFLTCSWTPVNCDIISPSSTTPHHHRHHHQHRHHNHNHHRHHSNQNNNNNNETPKLELDQEDVINRMQQDQNELLEMQTVETATLFTTAVLQTTDLQELQEGQEQEESSSPSFVPATIHVSHEKNHLWKLTVDNDKKKNDNDSSSSNDNDDDGRSRSRDSANNNTSNHNHEKNEHFTTSASNNVSNSSNKESLDPIHMDESEQNVIVKEKSESSDNNGQVVGCASCNLNKQLESALPTTTLRKMRLELVKEQILRKLGLKEPPNTQYVAKERLPDPVAQGNILPKRKHPYLRNRDREVEDFYGKTEQVIVFPEDVMPRCVTHLASPSSCFTFNLPQDPVDINSAELWVYKVPDGKDGRNQSLWVYEIPQLEMNHNHVKAKFIDAQYDVVIREGWMKLNLTTVAARWLKSGKLEHSLQVGCKTCVMDVTQSPILTSGDQRPFIVINYKNMVQKKRSRRNINCSSRTQNECCRESFVINFKEIGWDSWIIGPATYNAYFCKGSCINLNGMAHSNTRHTTVMQTMISKYGITNRTAEIVPCCAASKMSAISLIYRDPQNINTTLKYETLPNMVVDECSCI